MKIITNLLLSSLLIAGVSGCSSKKDLEVQKEVFNNSEFESNKKEILDFITKTKTIKPQIYTSIPLEPYFINGLKENVYYEWFNLEPRELFKEYKNSGKPSLTEFLNEKDFAKLYSSIPVYFDCLKIDNSKTEFHFISFKNLEKTNVIHSDTLYSNFLDFEPIVFENKDLKVTFKRVNISKSHVNTYYVTLDNKSNQFVDIKDKELVFYIGDKLIELTGLTGTIQPATQRYIHLAIDTSPLYREIKTGKETMEVSLAAKYMINNKIENILQAKKLSFK